MTWIEIDLDGSVAWGNLTEIRLLPMRFPPF
jgi:hypothetical protein